MQCLEKNFTIFLLGKDEVTLSASIERMFETVQRPCIRPLNPQILGDFDLQNPTIGGRRANAELGETAQTLL